MEDKQYRVKILPLFEDDLDNLSYLCKELYCLLCLRSMISWKFEDYYIIEKNIKTTYRKQAGYYMTERF